MDEGHRRGQPLRFPENSTVPYNLKENFRLAVKLSGAFPAFGEALKQVDRGNTESLGPRRRHQRRLP